MNHLQLLYIRVQQLKASFVYAQNIAAVWNYCHPWQFWSNSLNFSAGVLKKRPDAFTLLVRTSKNLIEFLEVPTAAFLSIPRYRLLLPLYLFHSKFRAGRSRIVLALRPASRCPDRYGKGFLAFCLRLKRDLPNRR